eukprot:1027167-Pelagomonas_calceolata.AAC.7
MGLNKPGRACPVPHSSESPTETTPLSTPTMVVAAHEAARQDGCPQPRCAVCLYSLQGSDKLKDMPGSVHNTTALETGPFNEHQAQDKGNQSLLIQKALHKPINE